MLLLTHEECIQHNVPEGHPERPARLNYVLRYLEDVGFTIDHPLSPALPIPADLVNRAHHHTYLERLEEGVPLDGLKSLDPDTWMSPKTLDAACLAAGAVWQGVSGVLSGDVNRVFCAVRPPGHHAEFNTAMGFCLLNSVAIAAINAVSLPGIDRVAILDFDVHHGNGTVDMCRDYAEILVCSSFQHPFYPNRFHDVPNSNIVNTPLSAGSNGDDFRRAISDSWWAAIEAHRPDLILISAGFDGHRSDPLAQLNLQESDYRWITKEIIALANEYSEGRIVSTLEGGYDLNALANSVLVHLEELAT